MWAWRLSGRPHPASAAEHGGRGFGKALLTNLARITVDNDYQRVEWTVLKWNTPSINFYESMGRIRCRNGTLSGLPVKFCVTLERLRVLNLFACWHRPWQGSTSRKW
ncbi:GNAT family N-acetyltransferase [Corynebacterium cystitidis]|uniref:Acetyltransferase (GNAT) family protein n=2 Tax=Corynebacterium cystitidis TaxID=35757 RepID=A0A1H9S7N9_9CORY|nr:Acetyltransferase (GNAT) family protein [Corynebacterium cystitidis DSM 20524]SER80189.1 Acetyltransferase (GNAT) family protein [Corynebacterium cystitidis DSM 20524]SNV77670.1 acetyltransferase [Corynebacterium cystitidis]